MTHVKNSHYFSHDSNARCDPKIMALVSKYGMEGYGRYWVIIEILSEQTGYKLKYCSWSIEALALAMQCNTEDARKFIDDCIKNIELFKFDGEYFWSESLLRRMKKKEEISRKRSEAGKIGGLKKAEKKEIANAKQMPSNCQAIAKGDVKSKIEEKRSRYTEEQLKIIDEYFDILRWTRKNGKIADSVMLKIYKEWEKHSVDKVIYALSVYISNPKYHDKKENYCYGIMRNATAEEVANYNREETASNYWERFKDKRINNAVDKITNSLSGD